MATKNTKKAKTTSKRRVYATHITTPLGQRVYISAPTKEELELKVMQARMEMKAGVDITNDPTFQDYALLWLKTYKAPPNLKPSSYELVRHNLEAHVIPFFTDMKMKSITSLHVQAWLNTVAGYSNSLQSKCVQIVRAVFRTAVDNGILLKSPVSSEIKAGGAKAVEKEPLTNEQAKQLLESVKGTRAYTFCLIALSTGMRRGEILGLMWEDIDWKANQIKVRHNKSFPANAIDAEVTDDLKTEAAKRELPMPKTLKAHLAELKLVSTSPYVLCMENGKSLSRPSFCSTWAIVERRCKALGFDCHPHLLRHTYITMLFEAGLDMKEVQYLAGHKSPNMTMRIYTHYRRTSRKDETAEKVSTAMSCLG